MNHLDFGLLAYQDIQISKTLDGERSGFGVPRQFFIRLELQQVGQIVVRLLQLQGIGHGGRGREVNGTCGCGGEGEGEGEGGGVRLGFPRLIRVSDRRGLY
jgi:hypothetical protein